MSLEPSSVVDVDGGVTASGRSLTVCVCVCVYAQDGETGKRHVSGELRVARCEMRLGPEA